MKSNIPTIALVGRPNVGKSTLFNRLIKKNQAIVSEKSGTTRDRNMSRSFWLDKEFNIYDTGGYSDELGNDAIQEEINFQVEEAMSVSDIIVFLVSAKDGVTNEDRQISSLLRNTKKNVIVAVNKSDNLSDRETKTFFYELGFSNIVSISALHGTGTGELYDEIIKGVDWNNIKKESESIKFALFGKQNVGKSTLTNAILGEERMIVSSIPGTTRDPINIPFMYKKSKFNIIDTAGIKRHAKTKLDIDKRSMQLAKWTTERIDVGVLVLDVEEIGVDQNARVAGYIHEAKRPLIIAVNKYDKVNKNELTQDKLKKEINAFYKFVDYSKIIFISALEKKGTQKLLDSIYELNNRYFNLDIKTSDINNKLSEWTIIKPAPSKNGIQLNLKYITFDKKSKSFILFCNKPELMHFSYLRYLENQIRKNYNFEGIPITIKLKRS